MPPARKTPKTAPAATSKSSKLDDAHKAALAEGRVASRAVRNYLTALAENKPRRGRKRTAESVRRRLDAITTALASGQVEPLERLHLVQERLDLTAELETMGGGVDLPALEAEFVVHAAGYSARKGITYTAWRELGVSAEVLRRAGISRRSG